MLFLRTNCYIVYENGSQRYSLRSLPILFCIADFHSCIAVTVSITVGIFYGVSTENNRCIKLGMVVKGRNKKTRTALPVPVKVTN